MLDLQFEQVERTGERKELVIDLQFEQVERTGKRGWCLYVDLQFEQVERTGKSLCLYDFVYARSSV